LRPFADSAGEASLYFKQKHVLSLGHVNAYSCPIPDTKFQSEL